MHNPSIIAEDIVTLFKQQHIATNSLLGALKKEYDCLNANDITALEGIVIDKQKCVTDLERYEKELFILLQKGNYEANNLGLKNFLQQTESDVNYSSVQNSWNDLLKATMQCNEQNVINARIINVASINVKQALNLLSGRNSDDELYGKSGKTVDGGNSQSFTVA